MPASVAPSGDLTLMFTDIEGSTSRWNRYPDRFHHALALHNRLIRQALHVWSGYEVKTIGDSFMVAFSDPVQAACCALAIQRSLEAESFVDVDGLRVRIGLHSASLRAHDNDYHGPAVNRTWRISDAGHGGMTLLSEEAAQQIRDRLPPDAGLKDLGLHRLKDLGAEQRLFRLTHSDLPERDYPPLRTLNALPHNFPAQVTTFVGRQSEIEELNALLAARRARLVTLTGPGGTGKTRLAMQVAVDNLQHFPEGVWLVDLAHVTDPKEVPTALALALQAPSAPEEGVGEARARVLAFLRARRSLLVLDNFEQVIDAARFVSDLLKECPQVVCLVTSRQLLHISGEQEYPVAPLRLPPPNVSFETCLRYDSVRVFVERSQTARPGFALTHETVPTIAAICHRLDGIPLALELAAARVRGMTPQQVLERMAHRLDLLASSLRDMPERQRTMRGAIDWSYDLLTEDERALFAELAVFSGGFFIEAAEEVCLTPGAFDLVFSLRDKSLLKADEMIGQVRYTMLETLREYALEKLRHSDRFAALCDRHADYYLRQAAAYSDALNSSENAVQRMKLDIENMRAGMDWTEQQDDCVRISGYGDALARFFLKQGLYREGDQRLSIAEAACRRGGDPRTLAMLLLQRGRIAWQRTELEAARGLLTESYELSKQSGDQESMVPVLANLGNIAWAESDFDAARRLYEEGLQLARETRQSRREASLLANLGSLASDRGEYAEATRCFDEALAIHRRTDNRKGVAFALTNSCDTLRRQKQFALALARLEESRRLFVALDDRQGIALTAVQVGRTLLESGQIGEARSPMHDALRIAQEIGHRRCEMYALDALARLAAVEGDTAHACDLLRRSFFIAQEVSDRRHIADMLNLAGAILQAGPTAPKAYQLLCVAARAYVAHGLLADAAEVNHRLDALRATLDPELATRLEAGSAALRATEVLSDLESPREMRA